MKNLILKLFVVFIMMVWQGKPVIGQDNSFARASATIITPLTAAEDFPLSFGRFFPGNTGGTITISPSGNVGKSATVVLEPSPRNPGYFSVTGQDDGTFAIALPNGPTELTSAFNSKTMLVSDWVTIPDNITTGIKLDGGTQTVIVGATLQVGTLDDNPKGIYTGSYQITFAYN